MISIIRIRRGPYNHLLAIIMKNLSSITKNTFTTCLLICVAYEIARINGWDNRLPDDSGYGFYYIVVKLWHAEALLVYAAIFIPFVVVACSKHNQKIQKVWFWFSIIVLIVISASIPGAMVGRWVGTHDLIAFFYWFVVPIPAIIFIVIGYYKNIANKSLKERVALKRAP
jgi:CDP-diglyceride synthetase